MIRKVLVFSFLLVAVFAIGASGQGVKLPSIGEAGSLVLPADKAGFEKDFLAALNPGSDLGIPGDKQTKLLSGNKSYVSDVMGLLGGKDSNDTKLSKITGKNKEWKNMVTGLLGDTSAGKYFSQIDKQLQGFKTKYQVAKLFLK